MAEWEQSCEYIVTGGSSGIGAAVIDRLAAEGHGVVNVARRGADSQSSLVSSIHCDLSDLDSIPEGLSFIKKMKALRGVVLCHGFGDFGALEQFSNARIQKLINTNLTSHIMIARLALPVMKTLGTGALVGIGSEAALQGGKHGAVYAATKFALRGLMQSLRLECSGSNVRVSIINPGMVDTPFFDQLNFLPGGDPCNAIAADEVAKAVVAVLKSSSDMVIDEINLSPLKTVVRHR